MPDWKPTRNLDRYPLSFHHAVEQLELNQSYPLGIFKSREQIRKMQNLFASFRAGWLNFPQHPTSRKAQGKEYRLKSFRRGNDWLLVCLCQPELGKLLQSALDNLEA